MIGFPVGLNEEQKKYWTRQQDYFLLSVGLLALLLLCSIPALIWLEHP